MKNKISLADCFYWAIKPQWSLHILILFHSDMTQSYKQHVHTWKNHKYSTVRTHVCIMRSKSLIQATVKTSHDTFVRSLSKYTALSNYCIFEINKSNERCL